MIQEQLLALRRPRQRDTRGRVAGQAPVAHRERQSEREHAVGLPHRGCRETRRGQVRDPGSHRAVRDFGKLDVLPDRQHVSSQQSAVRLAGRLLEINLRGEPLLRPLAQRDPRRDRVDVGAGAHGRRHRRAPVVGVQLAREVTRVLFASNVAVAGSPPSVRALGDVGHGRSSRAYARIEPQRNDGRVVACPLCHTRRRRRVNGDAVILGVPTGLARRLRRWQRCRET